MIQVQTELLVADNTGAKRKRLVNQPLFCINAAGEDSRPAVPTVGNQDPCAPPATFAAICCASLVISYCWLAVVAILDLFAILDRLAILDRCCDSQPLLQCWIAALLHCWIDALLDYCIAALLHCFIASLLDCWTVGLACRQG